jgi:hypothetical protein
MSESVLIKPRCKFGACSLKVICTQRCRQLRPKGWNAEVAAARKTARARKIIEREDRRGLFGLRRRYAVCKSLDLPAAIRPL